MSYWFQKLVYQNSGPPSPIVSPTLYHIIATLHCQRCIMSSTLYYIVNNVLYHQRCIILSMLHYFINAALHYRITLPHFLHYQWWTTSLTTPNINDAFCHQGFITMSVLHCIINAGLNYLLYTVINDVLHPRQGCMGNWNMSWRTPPRNAKLHTRIFSKQ